MSDDYRYHGMDPKKLDHLRRLYFDHGKLTAEMLAEDSKDPSSPFHGDVWSMTDAEAAWEHRLELCRQIIRKAKIQIIEAETEIVRVQVREWVNEERGDGYSPYLDVMREPERKAAYTQKLRRRMSSLAAELRAVDEFASVVDAIEAALAD